MVKLRKGWPWFGVALCLSSAPAWGGGLQINPQMDSAQGVPAQSAAAVSSHAAPLRLSGYEQWKSPPRTLTQVGDGFPVARSSFGMGMPLRKAVPLILPEGWSIYVEKGVDDSIPVTWKAKDVSWLTPLRSVLRQSGLIGTVNWAHEAVLLRVDPEAEKAASAQALPDLHGYHLLSGAGTPPDSLQGAGTPAPHLGHLQPVFTLNRGDLILTDLQKWGAASGWNVIWQLPEDWQVPNTTTFSGDFQKAVTQVIRALSTNGANVHAVFHTANNTVVISGAGGGE
ncbi:toxin co-regulated pilus biosynthesis Q family protein [Acidithiobacillus sp. IBUN Pt1247-S3]|uniref:toxin co-regulated pilus biosynthesis Q family protein n=1 Tax=Acidithiobacillus sp. IBUN Pt1247-S3 TaxID=3166642 RepID=UPI0034E5DC1A